MTKNGIIKSIDNKIEKLHCMQSRVLYAKCAESAQSFTNLLIELAMCPENVIYFLTEYKVRHFFPEKYWETTVDYEANILFDLDCVFEYFEASLYLIEQISKGIKKC